MKTTYLYTEGMCVSKSIWLTCIGKEIYHFAFVLLCIRGQTPSTSPQGLILILEGRFNGEFLALQFWGTYIILERLIHGGAYFRNFTVYLLLIVSQATNLTA